MCAPGLGKTWLACALAQSACQQGHSARCLRVPRLGEELRILHGAGRRGTAGFSTLSIGPYFERPQTRTRCHTDTNVVERPRLTSMLSAGKQGEFRLSIAQPAIFERRCL